MENNQPEIKTMKFACLGLGPVIVFPPPSLESPNHCAVADMM